MQSKIVEVVDRESAIKTAFFMAHPHDIILIAGKGHETYKEIAGVKTPFYEHRIVKDLVDN